MNPWNLYEDKMNNRGRTRRDVAYKREVRRIDNKLPNNLSYHTARIYPSEYEVNVGSEISEAHVINQDVAIIDTDNLNEKLIYSMPNEDISLGSLVFWMDNYWLVTERDANTTIYTKAKLIQCNHLLKWITPDTHEIMSQWCIIEDGTKLRHIYVVAWRAGNGT